MMTFILVLYGKMLNSGFFRSLKYNIWYIYGKLNEQIKALRCQSQGHSLTSSLLRFCPPSTFSNVFSSEAIGSIETIVYMEPPCVRGMEVCSE